MLRKYSHTILILLKRLVITKNPELQPNFIDSI